MAGTIIVKLLISALMKLKLRMTPRIAVSDSDGRC
jgi:hypothetical protein